MLSASIIVPEPDGFAGIEASSNVHCADDDGDGRGRAFGRGLSRLHCRLSICASTKACDENCQTDWEVHYSDYFVEGLPRSNR